MTLQLERLTSPEVKAALAAGFDTVLLPCGAVEQHGPHLPLGMDSFHASALAKSLAQRLGKALVAPTVMTGCSDHHLGFAGTISLRPATLEAIWLDHCTSLARHGFRRLCLFSGHVGNFPVLAAALPRLRAALPGVEILGYTDAIAWIDCWRRAVVAAGGKGEKVGGHADIAETALMLLLEPETVRPALFEPGLAEPLDAEGLTKLWAGGIGAISPNGILGDPSGATSAIGAACLEAMTALLAEAFARS